MVETLHMLDSLLELSSHGQGLTPEVSRPAVASVATTVVVMSLAVVWLWVCLYLFTSDETVKQMP